MRHFFLFLTLFVSSIAFAQTPLTNYTVRVYGYGDGENCPERFNKKGQMPPAWLKNKLTEEQYNKMVILNILADVNYDIFKYNTNIDAEMEHVDKAIKTFMDNPEGKKGARYDREVHNAGEILPYRMQEMKDSVVADYLIYSSIDGYDAHVAISITFIKNKKKGTLSEHYYFIYPTSMSKLEMKDIKVKLDNADQNKKTNRIVISKEKGLSEQFQLKGQVSFVDPLGCKHKEYINTTFAFAYPKQFVRKVTFTTTKPQ